MLKIPLLTTFFLLLAFVWLFINIIFPVYPFHCCFILVYIYHNLKKILGIVIEVCRFSLSLCLSVSLSLSIYLSLSLSGVGAVCVLGVCGGGGGRRELGTGAAGQNGVR